MTSKKGTVDTSSSSNVDPKLKAQHAEHERLQLKLKVAADRGLKKLDVLAKLDELKPGASKFLSHLTLEVLIETYEEPEWSNTKYIWIPPSEPTEEETGEKVNLDDEEQESVNNDKIVVSANDNITNGETGDKEEEVVSAGNKRKRVLSGIESEESSPPLPSNTPPSSLVPRTGKDKINLKEKPTVDDDDDDQHSQSQDGESVVVLPTPAPVNNQRGGKSTKLSGPSDNSTKLSTAAASAASAKKVGKGKGSAAAASGDNAIHRIPACLEVHRIQETLGLCDQIAKEHKIISAYEARGFTGKTTDYKACEMCLDKKIGNGRATSVCLGCSTLTHPQELFHVCWDHALQHGMEVLKARYCQQCFREAQEDGNV